MDGSWECAVLHEDHHMHPRLAVVGDDNIVPVFTLSGRVLLRHLPRPCSLHVHDSHGRHAT